jgi:hypothetical protein
MRICGRVAIAVGLLAGVVLMTGCLFNLFQTARTIGAGNAALTIGSGLLNWTSDADQNWGVTPQARLVIGLADGIDLGVHTGAFVPLATGDPGWLGAMGDLKFRLFHGPESFALALGFGGGNALELGGWGAFAEVFFDSNVRLFPVFFAYRPIFPFGNGSFEIWHHLAGGLRLRLSETARLLMEVDAFGGMISFGLGLEIRF